LKRGVSATWAFLGIDHQSTTPADARRRNADPNADGPGDLPELFGSLVIRVTPGSAAAQVSGAERNWPLFPTLPLCALVGTLAFLSPLFYLLSLPLLCASCGCSLARIPFTVNSLYAQAGVRRFDVVVAANGAPVRCVLVAAEPPSSPPPPRHPPRPCTAQVRPGLGPSRGRLARRLEARGHCAAPRRAPPLDGHARGPREAPSRPRRQKPKAAPAASPFARGIYATHAPRLVRLRVLGGCYSLIRRKAAAVGGFYVSSPLSFDIKLCFESLSCNRRRVGHL
jgi:hypothetical protein